jgi:hypothetical protein
MINQGQYWKIKYNQLIFLGNKSFDPDCNNYKMRSIACFLFSPPYARRISRMMHAYIHIYIYIYNSIVVREISHRIMMI